MKFSEHEYELGIARACNALRVLLLTSHLRAYLLATDPKVYKQTQNALDSLETLLGDENGV